MKRLLTWRYSYYSSFGATDSDKRRSQRSMKIVFFHLRRWLQHTFPGQSRQELKLLSNHSARRFCHSDYPLIHILWLLIITTRSLRDSISLGQHHSLFISTLCFALGFTFPWIFCSCHHHTTQHCYRCHFPSSTLVSSSSLVYILVQVYSPLVVII